MHNYVIGYYSDGDKTRPEDVFIALVNYRGDEKFYECYSPMTQHGKLNIGYLSECESITLDEYKEASKSFYTPIEYLQGVNEDEI